MNSFPRDRQFYKFSLYGFLKNLKFFDPFLILFFRETGLSFLEIGTLYSIREISIYIFEIPTGIIADTFGRRKSMIYAFISYILCFILFYFSPSFGIYALAMILFAAGEAFRSGTHKAMILEYLKINNLLTYKVDYYGHTRSASQFGSAISSLIAAGLVFHTGSFRIIFLASTVPYILDLFLMISYPKELDGEIVSSKKSNTLMETKNRLKNTIVEFKNIFKSGTIRRGLINASIFDAVFKTVKDYLQPIIKQYAVLLPIMLSLKEDRRTAIVIGIIYCILFLLCSYSARSADKIRKKTGSLIKTVNISYLSGSLLITCTGVLIILKLYIPAIIIFIAFYMLENVRRPVNLGCLSELIPNRIMASGLSGKSQLRAVFTAAFAPLMGFIADRMGVGAGLVIISLILIVIFPLVAVKGEAKRS